MPKYIEFPKGGQAHIVENVWHLSRLEDVAVQDLPGQFVLLSFSYWLKNQTALIACGKKVGVFFQVKDDVLEDRQLILDSMKHWAILAVDFPQFRDGRGFSTAAILRQQFAWSGPLHAIGDVLIDQLVQMARVGFDAFELRPDQHLETALVQLNRFPVKMQNDWRSERTLQGVHL